MVWVLLSMVVLSLVAAWMLLFQFLRQHGRLLLRLDRLEARLAASGLEGFQAPGEPEGVPVGEPLPSFRLPDVHGGTAALEDFRGKRVVLVQWSPGCGFCDTIAPDIAKAIGELRKRNTELVLVTSGDAELNRTLAQEHGFDCPMLLQDSANAVEAFAGVGTPAAYLLDEDGRVAEGLVLGADKLPQLLRDAVNGRRRLPTERSLEDSRIERDGIKPGTRAPGFTLPAVEGGMVSLDDYRGQRVLLVFSDPSCGPCDELAPQLVRLWREASRPDPALVMVSRGTADESRRKCRQHGITFPVVMQRGWRLSRDYGIFATPVAFLVDGEGLIARDVAKGPDAIVALARAELTTRQEAPIEA